MSDLASRLAEMTAIDNEQRYETGGLQHGFQIPAWIWRAMIAAYAIFFGAIAAATGSDGFTRFVIAISVGFAIVFFSLAAILNSVKGHERRSPLAREQGVLQTFYGPMSRNAVAAQILTVPACLAFFAAAILVIRLLVAR